MKTAQPAILATIPPVGRYVFFALTTGATPDALRESVNAFYYEKLVYLASMILRRANADDYRTQLCELKVAIAAGEKDPQLGRNPQLPRSIQLAAFLTLHAPRLWRWACQNFLKDRQ